MKKVTEFKVGNDTFELDANDIDSIIVQRHFSRYTTKDLEIQNLSIPRNPIWLNITVQLIRYYQKNISQKLGNRCVFDPSCSHYSEQAFRKKGFLKGIKLTIKRLRKCNARNGGIDELN